MAPTLMARRKAIRRGIATADVNITARSSMTSRTRVVSCCRSPLPPDRRARVAPSLQAQTASGKRSSSPRAGDRPARRLQVVIADLNKDGKPDIIASRRTSRAGVVRESDLDAARAGCRPGADDQRRAYDIDGDGIPSSRSRRASRRPRRRARHPVDPHTRADPKEPWTAREIDRVPTAHRCAGLTPTAAARRCW